MDEIFSSSYKLLAAGSPFGLIAALAYALIKIWPKVKEMQDKADQHLMTLSMTRIEALEKRLDREREECDEKIGKLHDEIKVMQKDAEFELRKLRHHLRNEMMLVDILLKWLKTSPEKAHEIVADAEALRESQRATFAAEWGTMTPQVPNPKEN